MADIGLDLGSTGVDLGAGPCGGSASSWLDWW
jgi:hypothetical protein